MLLAKCRQNVTSSNKSEFGNHEGSIEMFMVDVMSTVSLCSTQVTIYSGGSQQSDWILLHLLKHVNQNENWDNGRTYLDMKLFNLD